MNYFYFLYAAFKEFTNIYYNYLILLIFFYFSFSFSFAFWIYIFSCYEYLLFYSSLHVISGSNDHILYDFDLLLKFFIPLYPPLDILFSYFSYLPKADFKWCIIYYLSIFFYFLKWFIYFFNLSNIIKFFTYNSLEKSKD